MPCTKSPAAGMALSTARPRRSLGFYAPAQIVIDAKKHGTEVRPVCINRSRWDCTLEEVEGTAVRLGIRLVRGLATADSARIVAARGDEPFASVDDMWRRSGVPAASLVELAEADAFLPSLRLERRDALWAIKALRDEPLPLFTAAAEREARAIAEQQEPDVELRQMTDGHNVVEDYTHIGLTLREHPLRFLRADLAKRRIVTCSQAMTARDGQWLMAAGLVLVRQRPGSAKGVMFITIEDETGIANVVVWPKLFERSRRVVLGASMMAINGRIQREGEVVHLVAQQLFDLSADLSGLAGRDARKSASGGSCQGHVHAGSSYRDAEDQEPAFSVMLKADDWVFGSNPLNCSGVSGAASASPTQPELASCPISGYEERCRRSPRSDDYDVIQSAKAFESRRWLPLFG
ncbi:DNA polymerase III subunit alpha domain-containing protein (plasmid) [Rhizobium phaseoli]|nr:DNA polymerase III subunit alpha domain-containing protein [Rhizobium phaseoli]